MAHRPVRQRADVTAETRKERIMEEHIALKSKFWLNFADCCSTTMNSLLTGGGLTYLYVTYLGLDSRLAATVWLIFGVWNAFNDPLFGYSSDHTKSKLGRRIPYIRYGSFAYGLIFALSWIPFVPTQTGLFVQMLAALFLFDTLYTAIATSIYVMPYEMATSNKARSSLLVWRLGFSVISMVVPLVLLPLVKPQAGESAAFFRALMAGIGAFSAVAIFASTFFYRESNTHAVEAQPPFLRSVAQCFSNRAFLNFEVISFTVTFLMTILMTGVIYYFDAYPGVPMALCYGLMACGVAAGLAVWLSQRDRLGLKRCTILMCLVFMLGCAAMVFWGGTAAVAAAGFFAVGVGFSGGMYLVPLLNGDVIDYDELRTGARREGMYAGINSLICKPAISLANAAFPLILSFYGYNTAVAIAAQSDTARRGILVAWMALPALLLFVCWLTMHWYPLAGAAWDESKRGLAEKHLAAAAEKPAEPR
jgi:GPH family glycoside/pentoside/hexuronide:cation symporter